MKTKVLLFIIFTATLFALGTIITLMFNSAPETGSVLTVFYTAVFTLIFGLVFFGGYWINHSRFQALPPWQQTASVLRYGFLLGLLVVLLILVSAYVGLSVPLFLVLLSLIAFAEILWRKRRAIKIQ